MRKFNAIIYYAGNFEQAIIASRLAIMKLL